MREVVYGGKRASRRDDGANPSFPYCLALAYREGAFLVPFSKGIVMKCRLSLYISFIANTSY